VINAVETNQLSSTPLSKKLVEPQLIHSHQQYQILLAGGQLWCCPFISLSSWTLGNKHPVTDGDITEEEEFNCTASEA